MVCFEVHYYSPDGKIGDWANRMDFMSPVGNLPATGVDGVDGINEYDKYFHFHLFCLFLNNYILLLIIIIRVYLHSRRKAYNKLYCWDVI